MIGHVFWVFLALFLLIAGAEMLVRGSASLALRAGLTPLMAGLTVVAFGTSSPELVVSLKAAISGHGDIAVGNVIGSNIFNIGLILGLTAFLCPVPVQLQIIKLDAPLLIGISFLVLILLGDGFLGRAEGGFLAAGIVAYVALNLCLARRAVQDVVNAEFASGVRRRPGHWSLDVLLVAAGLGLLVAGSRLLVDNSVEIARVLGVSEAVIGLTIVAAGTSMPELAASVVAALRRQPDIAIGNIIGSNMFNLLGILGISSLAAPLAAPGIRTLDLWIMAGFSVLLQPLLWSGLRVRRIEGALLLLLYGGYLYALWPRQG